MSELKKKILLLKVKRQINRLKGIKDVHFLTTKPKEIAWYAGELNPINLETVDLDCIEFDTSKAIYASIHFMK